MEVMNRKREREDERLDQYLEMLISRKDNNHILLSSSSHSQGPPNCCSLHEIPMKDNSKSRIFSKSTLDIVRGCKQYVYDGNGVQYLDCVNGTSHVGHCHSQVVAAANRQMSKLVTSQGFTSDLLTRYVSTLIETMPEPLNTCYLTNSGSEACDLALRLAAGVTNQTDILVVDDAYHGNIGSLVHASPKMISRNKGQQLEHIHITKLPDFYRGQYCQDYEAAGVKYARDLEEQILKAEANGRKIGAFLYEPFFVIPGVHIPPKSFYQNVFRIVREHGGLIIADEVQSGLGRAGNNMWGFMDYNLVPDIVCIGKGLGNGYPMGAVVCNREISEKLGGYFSTFGGNPVACAIGLSVLEVIKNEKLMSSANMVGKHLNKCLNNIKERFDMIGDVRGSGLIQAIEIVKNKEYKTPDPELTSEILQTMKNKNILVAVTGRDRNVILITPPLCFNIDNSRMFSETLESILTAIKENPISIMERDSVILDVNSPGGKRPRLESEATEDFDALNEMD